MMFLFTTSDRLGSRGIRWALKEPVSHFAIAFDESENGYGIVFHSTMADGVHFEWWDHFYDKNKIVKALRPKSPTLHREEQVYQSIVRKFYGKPYDLRAYPEFMFYALRRRTSGQPIPGCSRFASSHCYLCTEIAVGLKEFCPEFVPNPLPDTLITPYSLFENMQQSKDLEHVPWISS